MEKDIRPYLLRALYQWCMDNGCTPYIRVWVNEYTRVPMQYVVENEIVLNIAPNAVQGLDIGDEWLNFTARFSGVPHDIWIPPGHVVGLFARENGQGMGFELIPYERSEDEDEGEDAAPPPEDGEKPKNKVLKFVKKNP
ncbi:MAG: ClpXP protease specificity-enhancing factor [Neisseria sp.]|nr:ClpXP protease specificity-enhancing factor [Neisseria sp.]